MKAVVEYPVREEEGLYLYHNKLLCASSSSTTRLIFEGMKSTMQMLSVDVRRSMDLDNVALLYTF